jgi:hypothetical protein
MVHFGLLNENYGNSSLVVLFLQKVAWAVYGQFHLLHLLFFFSGGFGNSFRAVFGQSHLIFGLFSGSF